MQTALVIFYAVCSLGILLLTIANYVFTTRRVNSLHEIVVLQNSILDAHAAHFEAVDRRLQCCPFSSPSEEKPE